MMRGGALIHDWQLTPEQAESNVFFIRKCLEMWDAGKDTADIAKAMFETEAAVDRALRIGRERRRSG